MHPVPGQQAVRATAGLDRPIEDPVSAQQMDVLARNCAEFGIRCHAMGEPGQGIVHVIGPEQGLTQPGMTIVCGDSHTATHGAFGALAFGIGTSEVEHVLATQTLPQAAVKTMSVEITGSLRTGVTAKDVVLAVIRKIGVDGGIGHVIEYRGDVIRNLSMEGRMTICNMTIEGGARAGLVAPDETTFAYLQGREFAPQGADWDRAVEYWRSLATDEGAVFDTSIVLRGEDIEPHVTWGTTPAQSIGISQSVPKPEDAATASARETAERSLKYMDLKAGVPIQSVSIDRVFLGSCTNGRLVDLQQVAALLPSASPAALGRLVALPGSALAAGEVVTLGAHPLRAGRSEDNDLVLDDDYASAHHARFEARHDGVYVEDSGSTNGTYVNGTRLDGQRRLAAGDVVRIGSTDLRFEP